MIKKVFRWNVGTILVIALFFVALQAQKIEDVDGIRLIHNEKTGKWGNNPKVVVEFVRMIGDIESDDENVLFYMPSDIAFDSQGNIYILDSGNHRIQKFDSDGKYIASLGNRGQGPGEFQYPLSLEIDSEGFMHISDAGNQRIQVLKPSGANHKTIGKPKDRVGIIRILPSGELIMGGGGFMSFGPMGMEEDKELPGLLKVLDPDGEILRDFGEQRDFKDFLLNRMGNQIHFSADGNNNTYIAFDFQNRIEKYSSDGKLLWRSDRKLDYSMAPPKAKGSMKGSGGRRFIQMPQMNKCSGGIAVDDEGRIWVVALKRQLKEDEQVQLNAQVSMSDTGQRSMALSVGGNTDVRKTDMYELEIYDPQGILLGKLPIDHFIDDIKIKADRLYLLDKLRGMQYYEYKIIDR